MEQALFWIFATVAAVSALLTITRRNAIYSALFLVLCFCSLAALYVLLNAQFIAAAQVIVYAGAIMVLFVFVVMLLSSGKADAGEAVSAQSAFGWMFGLILAMQAGMFLWGAKLGKAPHYDKVTQEAINAAGGTEIVAYYLFTKFLYPFEIVSILLLVAIVGSIMIARKQKD